MDEQDVTTRTTLHFTAGNAIIHQSNVPDAGVHGDSGDSMFTNTESLTDRLRPTAPSQPRARAAF